jgi:uncharacterized cupin superfamily protein
MCNACQKKANGLLSLRRRLPRALYTDEGGTQLSPGICAGFKAGTGNGHHLVNETAEDVLYLEIGDRTPGDQGSYPDDDLQAVLVEGKWQFTHKDGTPY